MIIDRRISALEECVKLARMAKDQLRKYFELRKSDPNRLTYEASRLYDGCGVLTNDISLIESVIKYLSDQRDVQIKELYGERRGKYLFLNKPCVFVNRITGKETSGVVFPPSMGYTNPYVTSTAVEAMNLFIHTKDPKDMLVRASFPVDVCNRVGGMVLYTIRSETDEDKKNYKKTQGSI